jgi:hypothetical protein
MSKEIKEVVEPNKDLSILFEQDCMSGFENADKESFAIPYLFILQALSPQLKDSSIEGVKVGLIMNNVTNELFTSVKIIPCAFQRKYYRWSTSERGALKGIYDAVDVDLKKIEYKVDSMGKFIIESTDKKGRACFDELVDTRMHYVLYHSTESDCWMPCVIAMSKTMIKKSKRWLSMMHSIKMKTSEGKVYTPSMHSQIYELTTVSERNTEGEWSSFDFKRIGSIDDQDLYQQAKDAYKFFSEGDFTLSDPDQQVSDKEEDDNF